MPHYVWTALMVLIVIVIVVNVYERKFLMQNARKAIAATAVPLIAAAAMWIATGQLNASEFATALSGLLTAILVYAVPNAVTTGESGHDPNLRR